MVATELAKVAAKVLKSYPIKGAKHINGSPIDRSWLTYCFDLFVDVKEVLVANEKDCKPTASKLFGRPFLPADLEWPDGYYFYAQLNMRELAPHDIHGILPERGMLYLFYNPLAMDFLPSSKTAAKAMFVKDEQEAQVLRAKPPKSRLPSGGKHYYQNFLGKSYRMKFETAFSFSNPETLPKGLIETMAERLGIRSVEPWCNLFGQPISEEGEGESGLFRDEEVDEEDVPADDPDRVMLLQRDFVDSRIHFWARRDKMRKGDFEKLEVTASAG
ncbi:MAG: DUF1963 domain-containing protein [Kofleriaceae bacterium]